MSKLGVLEDTLFVPMLGRIYASEHCPQIIYDKKALELKEKLPELEKEIKILLLPKDEDDEKNAILDSFRMA
mgnify:FL=1